MPGWFFDALEQGILRLTCELMAFIDDHNPIASQHWSQIDPLSQFPCIIDSIMAGSIYLSDIQTIADFDRAAGLAYPTGFNRWLVAVEAIERLGKDTSGAGLTRPSDAGKQVRWSNLLQRDRMGEGALNSGLSDQILQALGSVRQVQSSVHGFRDVRVVIFAPVGETAPEPYSGTARSVFVFDRLLFVFC